jgi:hypothetical protein
VNGPAPVGSPAPLWEDLFRSASPVQQKELLTLARRQGLLYAHQLPACPGNGVDTDRARHLLARTLGGHEHDLEPVRVEPVAVADAALDEVQREAVARALATPDFSLIQGLPGTGKSRVVAEIVTQAAARGEHVLLLAPSFAAVDRVLEAVASREVICAVRCLGREEAADALPPAARACTLRERQRRLREESLPAAHREAARADERVAGLRRQESLWPRLRELAAQGQQLNAQREALLAARASTAAEVERESVLTGPHSAEIVPPGHSAQSSFAGALCALAAARDGTVARIAGDLAKARVASDKHRAEQQSLTGALAAVRPLADAQCAGRFWSLRWWRALFAGDVGAQVAQIEARQQQVQAEAEVLGQEAQRLVVEEEQARTRFEAEHSRLVAAEVDRRHALLGEQEAALRHDKRLLDEKWQGACRDLQPASTPPADLCPAAVEAAERAWQEALRREEEQAAFAWHWVRCLEEVAETFPARLLDLCNVVAGTLTGPDEDPDLAAAGGGPALFDRLVLEDADGLTEAEFLTVARRARRWVLVGQSGGVSGGPLSGRPGFFERLWDALHCDPRRLPYAWVQERNGLCCRLRPVTSEQSQWLESERLADFPDIELRILAMPRAEPLLAEVLFPASLSIAQAKEFIFRELQELPVRVLGHSLRWTEETDRVVLRLADAPAPSAVPVDLGPGVREMLDCRPLEANGAGGRAASWHTCCVEFDRRAGWQRPCAEEWVREHLGLRDLGRTTRLDLAYRMRHPDLAAFLSGLLFADQYFRPAQGHAAGDGVPVEFVPVPPPGDDALPPAALAVGRRGGQARVHSLHALRTAPPPRKGGAGLELDLADPRHRGRLPGDLASTLPGQGIVNYTEAQAVVRTLETLAADAALRDSAPRAGAPALGVAALYPAQADLLRWLIQQSPTLAATDLEVVVDVPAGFRQRECLILLLSLTRSHTHRAVSFGPGPEALALALTRARDRLIVFGDTGTLARRCRWEAALDHLDEAASARERALLGGLVAYVQGDGPHRHAFRVREGSPA